MFRINKLNQGDAVNRDLYSMFIPTFADFPKTLDLPSKYFVLLFACDARLIDGETLLSWAHSLMDNGLVYHCAWGEKSEDVEEAVDWACVERGIDEIGKYGDFDQFVMTTSHQDDSLDEFLWYGLNCALPDDQYADECKSNLIVVVENEDWKKQILFRLSDIEGFNEMMLKEETDNEESTANN